MMEYEYWLANIPGIGNKTIHQLMETFESARVIYDLQETQLIGTGKVSQSAAEKIINSRKSWDLYGKAEELWEKNIHFLTLEQENYPSRLRNIYDAPYGLYY